VVLCEYVPHLGAIDLIAIVSARDDRMVGIRRCICTKFSRSGGRA